MTTIASIYRSVRDRVTGAAHRREASALRDERDASLERSAALRAAIDAAEDARTSGDNFDATAPVSLHA